MDTNTLEELPEASSNDGGFNQVKSSFHCVYLHIRGTFLKNLRFSHLLIRVLVKGLSPDYVVLKRNLKPPEVLPRTVLIFSHLLFRELVRGVNRKYMFHAMLKQNIL